MSACLVVTLVVFVLTTSVQSKTGDNLKCVAPKILPLKLSIENRHNLTGHWISKVGVENRAVQGQERRTTVDVEQSVISCQEEGSVLNMVFTFTASPSETASLKSLSATVNAINRTNGYELFPGLGIYKYHIENVNWTRAREVCAEEDAHLAIINSETESALFVVLFQRHKQTNGNRPWLGVHRIEDEFFTIFGTSLNSTGFTRWASAEPTRGTSYCVLVDHPGGGLFDDTCNTKRAFICEQEIQ